MKASYRDLAEFGLPLIAPEDPAFPGMVRDILSRPGPFGPPPGQDAGPAAVLWNRSDKAVVALSYVWRYTTAAGEKQTHRHSNFGSSVQMDVLAGGQPPPGTAGRSFCPAPGG